MYLTRLRDALLLSRARKAREGREPRDRNRESRSGYRDDPVPRHEEQPRRPRRKLSQPNKSVVVRNLPSRACTPIESALRTTKPM